MMIVNRLLGLVLGLALAVVGVLVLVELVAALAGQAPAVVPLSRWDQWLRTLSWDSQVLLWVLIGCVVVGIVLLAAELAPRRPALLPLEQRQPGRSAAIHRRALQDHLRRVALQDSEVVGATVRARRRRVKVAAAVPPTAEPQAVKTRLRDTLGEAVGGIGLRRSFRPAVTVRRARQQRAR